jgi:succinate dehydrogenase / fumarate reductase flavoprotein subunit
MEWSEHTLRKAPDMRGEPTVDISNVLVIGSGAAGVRAAIAARQAGVEVTVLGRRARRDAHTTLAAGGINAVLGTRDPEDSWEQHFADTLREGYFLADPEAVELLVREAPDAVRELAEWGCDFARTEDGEIDQRYFGAHKFRRTCYVADYTGRAIQNTLVDQAQRLGIRLVEDQYISSLLVADGTCFGAFGFDVSSGERVAHLADAVILATGGHTRLWRMSSSRRDENYGDGMLLAARAGAVLADMELVQFHPTGMTHPEEWAGTLVTEAVRGEGGHLRNSEGERFMERYDAERMELSARDRVAMANYLEIEAGRGGPNGGVFLDVSHLGKDEILSKIPKIYRQFIESQMHDVTAEPMEVAPTAHYSMGGIVVDPASHATDVDGLYAAGETTAGVHGANRLGGNSLAETCVFGRRAGEAAARRSRELGSQQRSKEALQAAVDHLDRRVKEGEEFVLPLMRRLRDAMWEGCGVVRDAEGLQETLEVIGELRETAAEVDVRETSEGWEDLGRLCAFEAGLVTAEATVRGAITREESRGAHSRSDFPEPSDELYNLRYRLEGDDLVESTEKIKDVRSELREWVEQDEEIAVAGRLLE